MAFSPPSLHLIATASADCVAKLWRARDGKLIAELQEHTSEVTSVAFGGAEEGSDVATGLIYRTISLWATATGQHQAVLEGHDDAVTSVRFSPDGRSVRESEYIDRNIRRNK